MRGIIVGQVLNVRDHPRGDEIWLADVDLGDGDPAQIVFGGLGKVVQRGCLVPVAPPGSRIPDTAKPSGRKMRRRTYRGKSSYGMLCSLAELGWDSAVTDQVAILADGSFEPGDSLDGLGGQWRFFTVAPIPAGEFEFHPGSETAEIVPMSGPVPCAVPA